ncbi:hypothetical protein [Primorskyibacter sp. S187A]
MGGIGLAVVVAGLLLGGYLYAVSTPEVDEVETLIDSNDQGAD